MHDVNPLRLRGRGLVRSPGLRGWVILTASATALLSFLTVAAVLLGQASHERHDMIHRGLSASVATVSALDREAEALGNTLRGLSRSPLLDADDLAPFYRQLAATPRPDGSRFVLWTPERQLLNTAVPFGAPLPALAALPVKEERLALLRRVGLILSERVHGPLDGKWVVAVSLRLEGRADEPDRILTLGVPEDHLYGTVRDVDGTEGWRTVILDHRLQELAGPDRDVPQGSVSLTRDVVDRLSGAERSGHFEADGASGDWAVAFSRSPTSGYTALSVAPAEMVDAPVQRAAYRIALAGGVLLLVGGASALLLMRSGGPVDSLRRDAAASRGQLAAANARMSDILGSISDCYFTLDRDYRITDVNAAAVRWWGLEGRSLAGRSYFDTVGRDPSIDAALAQAIGEGREFRGVLASLYHPGRFIDYRVYPAPEGAAVFFSDVTDRHEAHRAALREREFLQASLDALVAHIAILDDQGTILAVNEAWHRFGRDDGSGGSSHSVGTNYLDVCASVRHRGMAEERIFRGMEALVAGKRVDFQALCKYPGPDRPRWFQLRASRFLVGTDTRIVVAREDITDIITAREEVSEISGRLLGLQDEERRRIAAELHDSTAQHLVAAGLRLMQAESLGMPPAGRRILNEIDRSLEEALKELRVFTYLLHPPGLESDGLAGAVRAFADGFADRTGLHVQAWVDDGVGTLPSELQRALFRIVQEGLANVHRHAGASRAAIALRLTPGEVILCIGDDGHGMRPRRGEAAAQRTSLGVGIPGMRIRLSQFGGSLRIRSVRRGTVVRAAVPRDSEGVQGTGAAPIRVP
ncbi:PAS domain-containing sensor histidine kinase [Microvirga subterranea]|uniref:PAS domain-containing protein n=1 Tax=Microvirga subterranea TaxID=186651 RepID=A0A370HLX6_9HYPH|nr:PAS domain-containing protein [Microvirga subterranea]RDI57176.1 PAS domain-containing protein [Microvirga subterranea]